MQRPQQEKLTSGTVDGVKPESSAGLNSRGDGWMMGVTTRKFKCLQLSSLANTAKDAGLTGVAFKYGWDFATLRHQNKYFRFKFNDFCVCLCVV